MSTKQCTKCKETKSLSEYHISRGAKDGHRYWCKDCCRDASKKSSITPSGVYSTLKGLQTYYKKYRDHRAKPLTISREKFIEWYVSEPKICHYL